jgi:predicted permease
MSTLRESSDSKWTVLSLLDSFRQDFRFASRTLFRSTSFATVAVFTIGVGIGASSAIFSLLDIVFLKPLPVHEPERLVVLDQISVRGELYNSSYSLYEHLRDETVAFAGIAAAQDGVQQMSMTSSAASGTQAQTVNVALVSGEYFTVIGAAPRLGRTLNIDDNRNAAPVAVLSYAFWKRVFGGDPAVAGRTLTLDGQTFTVIGVAEAGFFGEVIGRAPDIWVPLTMQPVFDGGSSVLADPRVGWLRLIGRLRPGVTREKAEAELRVWLARARTDLTEFGKAARHNERIQVTDGSHGLSGFRERYSLPLRIMAGLVGVLLLISCANVSGLLLSRLARRQREVAIRLAIGAGRVRVVRLFLTESLLLAGLGGLLGVFLAWWGSGALLVLAAGDGSPILIDVTPNLRTLSITALVSFVAVLAIGLAPALYAARAEVGVSLKAGTGARRRSPLSDAMVIGQLALSLLLLSGAALFVQTVRNLRNVDLGFARDRLLQVEVDVEGNVPQVTRGLIERLSSLPGVEAVSQSHSGFATGNSRTCCIAVQGYTHVAGENREIATVPVAPGYFQAMSLPLLRGRDFAPAETRNKPGDKVTVAIVNQTFARRYFGAENPVGKRFGWGTPPDVTYSIEIVGVATDANYASPREKVRPLLYFPTWSGTLLTVRSAGAPDALMPAIRSAIRDFDPRLEILQMSTVSSEVERTLTREKLLVTLSIFFAVLAATLAAVGVYALMSQAVLARTREIGIRMAIGAQRTTVLTAELRSAFRLIAIGSVLGVTAALFSGRLIAAQLFNVSTADPRVLGAALMLLSLAGGCAAYLPARRASRVEPTVALRAE